MIASRSKTSLAIYHLGRLAVYGALGALSGLVGKSLLSSASLHVVSTVTGVLLGLAFVALGVTLLLKRSMHLKLPAAFVRAHAFLMRKANERRETNFGVFSLGVLTGLLPCGWLYTFVLASVATQSPAQGALVLLLFWMGTLPALTLSPLLIRGIFEPLARKAPNLSALVLICVGLVSVGLRTYPRHNHAIPSQNSTADPSPHCH